MMNLYFDDTRWTELDRDSTYGDCRICLRHKSRRAILALLDGLTLNRVKGQVVEASTGWDKGTRGLVRPDHEGQEHLKVVVTRLLKTNLLSRFTAVSLWSLLRGTPLYNPYWERSVLEEEID